MTNLDKARTCIERWRRRGFVEQVKTFEAVLAENERLRAALAETLEVASRNEEGDFIGRARAALGGET